MGTWALGMIQSLYDELVDFIIVPPFSIIFSILIAWCTITGISNYFGQQTNPYEYSKFAPSKSKNQVSGKVLYLIAYSLPFCSAVLTFIYYFIFIHKTVSVSSITYYHFIAPNILLILHFSKRLYETMYVHISTSKSNAFVAMQIGTFYAMGNIMMLYYQLLIGNASDYTECNKSFIIGMIVFIIGQYGNYYHHYLLRMGRLNMRKYKNKKNTKYVIPTGGFFEYVFSPHYLFEIIAWFGLAIVSKHLIIFAHTWTMFGYLVGRSKKTKEWYAKQFGSKCCQRKAIIPFLI